jgi:hypothetical protein
MAVCPDGLLAERNKNSHFNRAIFNPARPPAPGGANFDKTTVAAMLGGFKEF